MLYHPHDCFHILKHLSLYVLRSTTWTAPLRWVMWWSGGRGTWWETRIRMWSCSAASRVWTLSTLSTPATQEVSLCVEWLHMSCVPVVGYEYISVRGLKCTFPFPQVSWSWRPGTTWSCWSLVQQPTCPWMEMPPSWVLSSWLKGVSSLWTPRGRFCTTNCATRHGSGDPVQLWVL